MKLSYEAYDQVGLKINDMIEAADVDEATDKLRRQGLFVTRIDSASSARGGQGAAVGRGARGAATKPRRAGGRTRRLKNAALFARQMYVLISSGTRVVEALEALERQTKDEAWCATIADIRARVEGGQSLAEATSHHPHYFDAVSQNLIGAGEATGKLPEMLNRLSALTQKQIQVRSALAGAMVYPILLVFVSIGVLCAMLLFVLPRFTGMFQVLQVPLPPTTKALIMLSDVLRTCWWAILIAGAGGVVGFRYWLGSAAGRRQIDTLLLRLPHVGRIMRNFATARIARLLGIMLDSYMPLLEVLALIRQTMSNVHYAQLIQKAEQAVSRGQPISSTLADSDLIIPAVAQVVRSGEQSGQVAPLLLNMADLMDEENEVIVKSLTSIIEPLILVVLGLLVGFVAMSMFLPLFDLMGGPPGTGGAG